MNRFILAAASMLVLLVSACKKEDPKTNNYTIPETYNFANADYTTSINRLNMLSELTTYIRTTHSNTDAPILDAQKLKAMYANLNNPFAASELNSSGLQLKNKTNNKLGFVNMLEASFDDAVIASTQAAAKPTETTAYDGYAGKLINGTRYILVDSAGVEYKEIAEKGIMGAVFYSEASKILTDIGTFDNTTLVNGATAQEKAWDEAFGYFGVPTDFPANVTGLKNWGSYCNTVSIALGGAQTVNSTIMNAWIKGRAAIANKDNNTRDAQRDIVLRTWEKVCAARFISYVKGAKANIAAPATFHHNISEALGFINAFHYNPSKTISDADLETLMGYFKTNNSINIYKVTTGNLDNAINKMAFIFGLDASLL